MKLKYRMSKTAYLEFLNWGSSGSTYGALTQKN